MERRIVVKSDEVADAESVDEETGYPYGRDGDEARKKPLACHH